MLALGAALHRPAAPPATPNRPELPPRPADLTIAESASPVKRAREAWRTADYRERLDRTIIDPRLPSAVTVAVMSPKGGVGKTTMTALIGTLLSQLRRDRVVAVDTNPDYGSLGRVLTPDQQIFVDDLLDGLEQNDLSITELDSHLGRAAHGLMVLPAPTDPARMARLDENAYLRVIRRLKTVAGAVLLDCGTGLQEPPARAAIASCNQILLVTDAEPATASLVLEAAHLLARSGKPLTVAVNKVPSRGNRLNLEQLSSYLPPGTGVITIPEEDEASRELSAGKFDWRNAPESWQISCRELLAVLVSQWGHLPPTDH
jgi:MinD-like ATPase involved in chromosome partitioning or flagellar assembly